jgi:hypothetical protein
MGVSGSWLRQNFMVDPPTPLHQADPAHAVSEPGDPTVGAWSGPPILDTDPAPYLIGESVPFVVDTDGLVLDYTVWGDHEDGYASENYGESFTMPYDGGAPADVQQAHASGYAHTRDYGAARKHVYDTPPFQATDERYLGWYEEGFGPVELPALAGGGQRGLNSYGVNNPGMDSYGGHGYRFGWTEKMAVDRKMYDPVRINDERLIQPNTATEIDDQPVPGDAGPYNPPFTSLARIIATVNQKPMMRRQPPAMDQSIMTDGTDDTYDADNDWVIG